MEQELRRIKSKDLSALDDRLFGNLEKVQTINSTIENLGQFQQFLLAQITQFQQKAKGKHSNNTQANEVIQQNCMTLRQSILRVGNDLQSSRSIIFQQIETTQRSPKHSNPLRLSTPKAFDNKVEKTNGKENEQIKNLKLKIEQMEIDKIKYVKKYEEIRRQMMGFKSDWGKLRSDTRQAVTQLKGQIQKLTKRQLEEIGRQNVKLKKQIKQIQISKQTLQKQVSNLKQNSLNAVTRPYHYQRQQELQEKDSLSTKKALPHQSKNQSLRGSYVEEDKSNPPKEYMSFMDKMRLDFTEKLARYHEGNELTVGKKSFDVEQESDTFRQSNVESGLEGIFHTSDHAFRSMEISRHLASVDPDPNVPRLLRRPSIGQYQSYNGSQQSLNIKSRLPLQNYDSNCYQTSSYQSTQKSTVTRPSQSTSKNSNHVLMRKTKSNFFKKDLLEGTLQSKEKQNVLVAKQNLYETNIAKMKGLCEDRGIERKRGSQSKQKLKIFSMI